MKKEEEEKKKVKEEISKLKKRKKEKEGDLLGVCKEILEENYIPWKRRRILEEGKWDEIQKKEKENWERTQRRNKANEKKKELLDRLERKKKLGKPIEWISRKKVSWREYRERSGIMEEELEEVRRNILLA